MEDNETITQKKGLEIGLKIESILTISAHPGDEAIPLSTEVMGYLTDPMSQISDASEDMGDLVKQGKGKSEEAKLIKKELDQGLSKLMKAIPPEKMLPLGKKLLKHSKLAVLGENRRDIDFSDELAFSHFFTRNVAALPHLMREVITFNNFLGFDPTVLLFSPRMQKEAEAAEKAAKAASGNQ